MNDTALRQTAQYTAGDCRIAVITDAAPERNGVGSYYADLVAQLNSRIGHAELIYPLGGRIGEFHYLTAPLPGDSSQRVALPRPRRLWNALERINPDVVVIPTPGPFGIAANYMARRKGIPVLIGFHTHYEALADLYWNSLFGKMAENFLIWTNRSLFRHCVGVFANSPEMQAQAEKMGAENVQLMGTPIPEEFLTTPVVNPTGTIKNVLFAGRLAKEKNLPAIVEAAKDHPDLTFTIAGDGPLRQFVAEWEEKLPNLNSVGWVSRTQLLSLMDENDALLLPSHVESFGTVALEGMTRARPVIVSKDCGISEWPSLRKATLLVADDETPGQTLARMKRIPAEDLIALGQRARAEALSVNDWNLDFWIDQIKSRKHAH